MNNLLKYREKLNLTQNELAEKAGVSVRTIQRIEKGAEPKGYTLKVLSKALEISEEELKGNVIITKELEDDNHSIKIAKWINLSSVLGVAFPPVNILFPFILMKVKKQENKLTKQIISLQIFYTIIAVVAVLLSPFIRKWFDLNRQFTLIIVIFAVLFNLFIILRNTIGLDKNKKLYFKLNFSFF
ncbi:helix-turn-helix domain-containing protein [Aureivirga sp. CE67]|uniref:helix-turn-helix domain-containing protein n=1 Tax=Aureivirga sp. CE67 TaxID=1788983 RepID=UPI001E4FC3CB|nr:helix-turn-helix domain-containing protein [Aureivirga sp. CE67]